MIQKTTNSQIATKEFAKEIAKKLTPPVIISLYGNLGSGKTTFVQGLAAGLGIDNRITSPTFVFMRQYKLDKETKFYHVDLYRLESEKDTEAIGLKEILESKEAIIAIEWPEKIEHLLPKLSVKIKLKTLGENQREISID